ncbi:hypothetical protein SJH87_11275 [Staphylococcus sp. GCP4]|nr:hypothetical protein [Staphylococcus sp. GCP4]
MNKDNYSKNTAILVILGSIILIIISSYLAIGEITKFKNVKEILQIIISIVGLFATFGGAYLGAKISGQIARDNMLDEIRLNKYNELERMNLEYQLSQLRYIHEKTTILYFDIQKIGDFIFYIIEDVYRNLEISEKNIEYLATEFEKITESIKVVNNELEFLSIEGTIDIGNENYTDISRDLRREIKCDLDYFKNVFCNCDIKEIDGGINMANIYSYTGKEVSGVLMLLQRKRKELLNQLNDL